MGKTEQLLEAFLDLERSRQRESELRVDYESQLQGIRSIIEAESKNSLFTALVRVLKILIHCEHVFILKSEEDGSMRPSLSTRAQIQDTRWFPDTLFQRILSGKPAAINNQKNREKALPLHCISSWREVRKTPSWSVRMQNGVILTPHTSNSSDGLCLLFPRASPH